MMTRRSIVSTPDLRGTWHAWMPRGGKRVASTDFAPVSALRFGRSAMFVEQRVLAQDRLILRAQCTLMGVEVINSDVFYFVEPRGCVAMVHQSSDSRKRTPNVEKHKVFVIATTHLVCHHFALPAARRLRISSR